MAVGEQGRAGGGTPAAVDEPRPIEVPPAAVGGAFIGGFLAGAAFGPLGAVVGTPAGAVLGYVVDRVTAPRPSGQAAAPGSNPLFMQRTCVTAPRPSGQVAGE